jgi:hypothetical protein
MIIFIRIGSQSDYALLLNLSICPIVMIMQMLPMYATKRLKNHKVFDFLTFSKCISTQKGTTINYFDRYIKNNWTKIH